MSAFILYLRQLSGPTLAAFFARYLLAILFTMAGLWKVFTLGADVHASRFFVEGFKDYWIPGPLLYALGWVIPWIELLTGVLLLLGVQIRLCLCTLAVLLLITTYGHALQEPLFDIDGHTFTRMALILFLLMLPPGADQLSWDGWRQRRKNKTPA